MILAYIDPGAGSLLIQALIAALISVPFVLRSSVRRAFHRIRSWIGRDHDTGAANEPQHPTS